MPRAERIGQRYLYYHRLRVVDYLCRDLADDTPDGPPRGIHVDRITELPGEEVDALFERVAEQRGLLTRRSAAYLGWRYQQAHGELYEIWGARRGSALAGLIVLRPALELVPGACGIVDWLAPGPDATSVDAPVVDALLAAATRRGREESRRVLLAVFADPAPEHAALRARGFSVVPSGEFLERRLTYQIYDRALSQDFVREHWWYTLGDSDLA